MDSEIKTEQKENRGMYWVIAIVAAVACAALIMYKPEWLWLTLPFLFTYLVKALDMM